MVKMIEVEEVERGRFWEILGRGRREKDREEEGIVEGKF